MPDDSAKKDRPRGLYPLIDADACEKRGLDLLECARAIIDAGPPIIQLRAKGRSSALVQNWGEALMRLLPAGGPRLIINDRADIADLVGAHGVHVGQEDLPPGELLRQYPRLDVGLSTHNEQQLTDALEIAGLRYVALGPVFPTQSKDNAEPSLSLQRLEAAFRQTQARGMVLVAIGGITEETLVEVSRASDLVAAIGMVLPDARGTRDYSWVRDRCSHLNETIRAQI